MRLDVTELITNPEASTKIFHGLRFPNTRKVILLNTMPNLGDIITVDGEEVKWDFSMIVNRVVIAGDWQKAHND